MQWENKQTTRTQSEHALLKDMVPFVKPPSMHVLSCSLSRETNERIVELGSRHGFLPRQTFALRRNVLKCRLGQKAFQQLEGQSHDTAKRLATEFERVVERHFANVYPGVKITTEAQLKASHVPGTPLPPTPDLVFDRPVDINGRKVCWVDAKFMCIPTRTRSSFHAEMVLRDQVRMFHHTWKGVATRVAHAEDSLEVHKQVWAWRLRLLQRVLRRVAKRDRRSAAGLVAVGWRAGVAPPRRRRLLSTVFYHGHSSCQVIVVNYFKSP